MSDLPLAHVSHHQSVGDLGSDQTEHQDIEDGVVVVDVLVRFVGDGPGGDD